MFLVILLGLVLPQAHALIEDRLSQDYERVVTPLMSKHRPKAFTGAQGTQLTYAKFERPGARGSVVLVPGYTESYLKYGEVIVDLLDAGFNVFTYDHRGMGLSPRLASDPQIVHVSDFQSYVEDLRLFVSKVAEPHARKTHTPLLLLAHSMGGLVAAHYLAKEPGTFHKAAMSAPFFDLNTRGTPQLLVYWLVGWNVFLGADKAYAPTLGAFDPKSARLENSLTTHSAPRFHALRNLWLSEPATLMSGASNGWLRTSLEASWRSEKIAPHIRTPLMLFQAGEDHFGNPAGQDRFCRLAKECRKISVKGAYHELLMEKDVFRQGVLDDIVSFFSGV